MAIINEIKKIFNIKVVILLMLGISVIYSMFIMPNIQYTQRVFSINEYEYDRLEVTLNMVDKYGKYLDESEFEDFKLEYEKKVEEIDNYLGSLEKCKEYDIDTYKKYREDRNLDDINKEIELWEYKNHIFYGVENDLLSQVQDMEPIIYNYENRFSKERVFSDWPYKERVEEIESSGEINSIIDPIVLQDYNGIVVGLGWMIIFTVIVMISSIFIKDKMRNVESLIFTSKKGRKIYMTKIIAAIISTIFVVTIEIGIVYINYFSKYYDERLYNNNINSFNNGYYFFDITVTEYIICITILLYLLSIIACLGSMYISNKGKNYISVIVMQIPFIAVLLYVLNLTRIFLVLEKMESSNALYSILRTNAYRPGVLCLILIIIVVLLLRRNYKINQKISI